MVRVFSYPKVLHVRTQAPPQFTRYTSYRPFVEIEFSRRCVYCRLPDLVGQSGSFSIDHYRPSKKFESLVNEYSNLYWCCHACNSIKQDYWPDAGDEAETFIPNPCEHRMFEHLRMDGLEVEGRTTAGAVAIRVLRLNRPDRIRQRRLLQTIAESLSGDLKRFISGLQKLSTRMAEDASSPEMDEWQERRDKFHEKIAELRSTLDLLVAVQ